jgi:hypothetical protein
MIDGDLGIESGRSLAFGPVRHRRQALSVFYPILLAILLARTVTGIALSVVILAVGVVFMFRARAMRVEIAGDSLLIRNMFLSESVPLSDIEYVALSRPITAGQTAVAEVSTPGGKRHRAYGLSVQSDAFTPRRRFRSKRAVAQVGQARQFFREYGIDFLKPPG